MMTTSIDLTPAEIRKAGWEALVSQLGVAKSLRFLLEYDKGQGNYTELRRELFAGQTVGQILKNMAEEGIVSEGDLAPAGTPPENQ
ncbi:MAG: hypothetical protein GX443_01775 [Deltaproteobacteria bacterium]|nr:hypothetical protein [Deltaproteobacteria bacterium]